MAVVGSAEVLIRAITATFREDVKRALDSTGKDAEKSGAASGEDYSGSFMDRVRARIANAVQLEDVAPNVEADGATAGSKFGSAFSDNFKPGLGPLDFSIAEKDSGAAGSHSGSLFDENFNAAASKAKPAIDTAGIDDAAQKSGQESGGRFTDAFNDSTSDFDADLKRKLEALADLQDGIKKSGAAKDQPDLSSTLNDATPKLDFDHAFDDAAPAAEKAGKESSDKFGSSFNDVLGDQIDFDSLLGELTDKAEKEAKAAGHRGGEAFNEQFGGQLDLGIDDQVISKQGEQLGLDFGDGFKRTGQLDLDFGPAFDHASDDARQGGHDSADAFDEGFRDNQPQLDLDFGDGHQLDFGNIGGNAGKDFRDGFDRASRDRPDSDFIPDIGGDAEKKGGDAGGRFSRAFNQGAGDGGGGDSFLSGFILRLAAFIPIIAAAVAALSTLVSGLYAVASAAAVAATGGLAILPGLLLGLVAGAGVAILAFSGVGNAVKALGEQQANAAKDAQAHAKAVESAARSREAAEESVKSAQQGVASAERGVAKAQESVIEAQTRVTRSIESLNRARRDAARSAANAAQRVVDAEQSLVDAQATAKDAQAGLTREREKAKEKLEDLALSVRGAALSEEDAEIRLIQSRERYMELLRQPNKRPSELAAAELDTRQAQLALDQARDRREDINKEAKAAAKAGVEGSTEVVAAKKKINDADKGVAKAERAVRDARQAAADTAVNNAERIADANRSVADSQKGVVDAQERVGDAQLSLANAHSRLARAQRDLTRTIKDGNDAIAKTSTSADKVRKAFAGMPKAAQEFAKYLFSIRDRFKEIKEAAANGVLPGVTAALKMLTDRKVFDVFLTGIKETAGAVGELFRQLGRTFSSPAALRDLQAFFKNNAPVFTSFEHAITAFFRSMLSLTAGVGPQLIAFSSYIDHATSHFSNFIDVSRGNGDLQKFMKLATDSVHALGDAFGGLFSDIKTTALIAAPFGNAILHAFGGAARAQANFFKTPEGAAKLQAFFGRIVPLVAKLGKMLGALGAAFLRLGDNKQIGEIADILRLELIPQLEQFIDNILTRFGPQIAHIASDIAKFLNSMSKSAVLKAFVSGVASLVHGLAALANNKVGREILALFLIFAVGFSAISKVNKALDGVVKISGRAFRGVANLARGLQGVGARNGASAAGRAVNALGRGLGAIDRAAKQAFGAIIKGAGSAISSLGRLIKTLGSGALSGVKNLGTKISSRVSSGGGGGDAGSSAFRIFGGRGAKAAAAEAEAAGKASGDALADGIRQGEKKAADAAAKSGKGASEALGRGIRENAGKATGEAEKVAKGAGGRFSKIGGLIKSAGSGIAGIGRAIGSAMTVALGPVGLIIAAVALVGVGLVLLYKKSETFRNIVNGAFKSIGDVVKSVYENVVKPYLVLFVELWATVAEKILGAAITVGKALHIPTGPLEAAQNKIKEFKTFAVDALNGVGGAAHGAKDNVEKLSPAAQALAEKLKSTGTNAALAAAQAKEYDDKQKGVAASAKTLKDALQGIIDKFSILKGNAVDQEAANEALAASFDSARAAIRENGATLDINSEKGRANRTALLDVARALDSKLQSDLKANTGTKGATEALRIANETYEANRIKLIQVATQSGLSKTAAQKYVDTILKTPAQVKTDIKLSNMDKARAEVQALGTDISKLSNKTITIIANAKANGVIGFGVSATGQIGEIATGGYVSGPGHGTSDDVPAWLSNGEYVVRASSVKKYGTAFLAAVNQGRLPAHVVSGGAPPRQPSVVERKIVVKAASNAGLAGHVLQRAMDSVARSVTAGVKSAISKGAGKPSGPTGVGNSRELGKPGRGDFPKLIEYLKKLGLPFRVNSTTGGKHAKDSYHYQGRAVDFGPAGLSSASKAGQAVMQKIFNAFLPLAGSLKELFYTTATQKFNIKNGHRIAPFPKHSDHVHAAFAKGGLVNVKNIRNVTNVKGSVFNPHIRDTGGPLLPGFTYNGTGKPEYVVPPKFAEGGLVAQNALRTITATTAAVRSSSGGSTGIVQVLQTILQQLRLQILKQNDIIKSVKASTERSISLVRDDAVFNVPTAARGVTSSDPKTNAQLLALQSQQLAEQKAQTALLTRVSQQPGGIHIDNLNAVPAPNEQAATSVPRALRELAFQLGV